jgi:hypothetical protein
MISHLQVLSFSNSTTDTTEEVATTCDVHFFQLYVSYTSNQLIDVYSCELLSFLNVLNCLYNKWSIIF